MIAFPAGTRVWIAGGVTDMRCGMNSLALKIQQGLGRDPHSGEIFCFRGRKADVVKLLWFDGIGASLYAKRLEAVFVKGVVTIPSFHAARSAGPSMGAPPPALWGSASSPPWPLRPVSGRSGFSQTEPIGVHCRVLPDQRSGCAARAAS